MKYFDADKLKVEIKRLEEMDYPCDTLEQSVGFYEALDCIKFFIDSLQQEQLDVYLEKELDNYMDGYFSECQDGTLLNDSGSELQYEDVNKIAKYFYELGLKARKEE